MIFRLAVNISHHSEEKKARRRIVELKRTIIIIPAAGRTNIATDRRKNSDIKLKGELAENRWDGMRERVRKIDGSIPDGE